MSSHTGLNHPNRPSTPPNRLQRRCTRCNMPMKGHPRDRDRRLVCQVQAPELSISSLASGSQLNADPFLSSQHLRNFNSRYALPGVPENQVHLPVGSTTTSQETEHDGSNPPEDNEGPSKTNGIGSSASGFIQSVLKRTPTPYPLSFLPDSLQREQIDADADNLNLPAVGVWDRNKRNAWSQPPTIEEMQQPLTIQNAPTELVNSIGDPLDIGDKDDDEDKKNGGRDPYSTSPWRLLEPGSDRATMRASPIPEYNNRFIPGWAGRLYGEDVDESTRARDLLRVVEHPPIYAAIPASREEVPLIKKWAETNNLNTHIVHNPTNFTRRSIFKTPNSSAGGGNGGNGGGGGSGGGGNRKGKGKGRETETEGRGTRKSKEKEKQNSHNPLRGEPSWTVVVGQNRIITNRVSDLTYRLIMRPFASEDEILAEPMLITPGQLFAISLLCIFLGGFMVFYLQWSL